MFVSYTHKDIHEIKHMKSDHFDSFHKSYDEQEHDIDAINNQQQSTANQQTDSAT